MMSPVATVCYSCATAGGRENRPLISLFAEETGGSRRAEFKMNAISDDTLDPGRLPDRADGDGLPRYVSEVMDVLLLGNR
jgi:hypothetical protein